MLESFDYITETTKDLTGPWYLYLNELVNFFKLYKVSKSKKINTLTYFNDYVGQTRKTERVQARACQEFLFWKRR